MRKINEFVSLWMRTRHPHRGTFVSVRMSRSCGIRRKKNVFVRTFMWLPFTLRLLVSLCVPALRSTASAEMRKVDHRLFSGHFSIYTFKWYCDPRRQSHHIADLVPSDDAFSLLVFVVVVFFFGCAPKMPFARGNEYKTRTKLPSIPLNIKTR